jgi:hypothetical protein
MSFIATQHVGEAIENSKNLTIHRDATTKLGRYFYGVTVSNEKKENFITGIKEIKDIKATTYADYTLSKALHKDKILSFLKASKM